MKVSNNSAIICMCKVKDKFLSILHLSSSQLLDFQRHVEK